MLQAWPVMLVGAYMQTFKRCSDVLQQGSHPAPFDTSWYTVTGSGAYLASGFVVPMHRLH